MTIKIFLKTALSVTLLVSIFLMVDIEKLVVLLKKMDIKYILIAVFFGLLRTASGIYRLFYLLQVLFKNVSMPKVARDSLIAGFYNLFLPTALGGDVPKIFLLNSHLDDKKRIVASILTERFLGFFSLIVLALLSILTLQFEIENYKTFLLSLGVFFFIFIAILVLVPKLALSKTTGAKESGLRLKLISVIENLQIFKARHICIVFFQSLVYQSLGIFLVYFLGAGLGMKLGMFPYFVTLPLVWFTIMIPVSISGIGLREGAFIYFFKLFGVSQEMALGLSILFYLQNLLMGSVGGILLFKSSFSGIPGSRQK